MEQNNAELTKAIAKIKEYRFLEAIKKENCTETAEQLARFFYTLPDSKNTHKPPITQLYAIQATDDLIISHSTESKEIHSLSNTRRRKLSELREALLNVNQLLQDTDIIDHYYTEANSDHDISAQTALSALNDYHKKTLRMGINLDLRLQNKRKPGRPSLDSLTNFVVCIAEKYNELSDEGYFYARKDQDDNGQYLWHATNGGLFISEAINWMYKYCETSNQFQYTHSQIYTACNNAQNIIRQQGNKE